MTGVNGGADLSSRERNVLRLAIQGHTDDEIAEQLLLQPGTVRRQLRSAMARLAGARSQTNGDPRNPVKDDGDGSA